MKNYINHSFYAPLLARFCQSQGALWQCGYPYGLFIPYAMSAYKEAGKKIFYIGRDTYYWVPAEEMLESCRKGTPEAYLQKNSEAITVDKMLEWKNQPGSFWTLLVKLHLMIRTGRWYEDVTTLGTKELALLEEIGYGNLNAIELSQSLQNEGVWEEIEPSGYNELKRESRCFDKLKLILDAYQPDIVFIFNWEERDDIFDGLNVKWHKEWYEDGMRAVYTIEGYRTKVIWSSHPRRFSFLGTNLHEMVNYLATTLKTIE